MLHVTYRNTLQQFRMDSLFTEEASEAVYKLPDLRSLSVVINKVTSLPSALCPNLIKLKVTYNNEDDWPRLFHGAMFGNLESVTFPGSEQIGDFLGAFERAALSSSIHNTLSKFRLAILMGLRLFFSPSIYGDGRPRYRILLRWRVLEGGRQYHYQTFAGNAEAGNPWIRR